MGLRRSRRFFHGGSNGGVWGSGQIDGAVWVGGLVFQKLVTTDISIAEIYPSYIDWKLNTLLIT